MDDFCLGAEFFCQSNRAVVKADAKRKDQVRVVHRLVCRDRAVHSDHSQISGVCRGNGSDSHKARNRRNLVKAKKRLKVFCNLDGIAAASQIGHGLFAFVHRAKNRLEPCGNFLFACVEPDFFFCARYFWPRGKFNFLKLNVSRNVNQNRAGPSCRRDFKSLWNRSQKLGGALYHHAVLCNRERKAKSVGLLEGVGSNHRKVHLARNRDNRNRVAARVGDGRQKVHRARAAGGHANGGLSCCPREALCDEARGLFLADKDMLDSAPGQFVVKRQNRAARNSRHGRDFMSL